MVVDGEVIALNGSIDATHGEVHGQIIEIGKDMDIDFSQIGFSFNLFPVRATFNIITFLGVLVLALIITAIIPTGVGNMADFLSNNYWRAALIGLLAFVAMPFVLFALLVVIIGIPLIPFVMLLYVVAIFLGYIGISFFVGQKVLNQFKQQNQRTIISVILGLVLLRLVRLIPFLGLFIGFILVILALGLTLDSKFGTLRPWFPKKKKPQYDESKDEE